MGVKNFNGSNRVIRGTKIWGFLCLTNKVREAEKPKDLMLP